MSKSIAYKNYFSLDIAKFICALMIVSAHFAAERGKFPLLIDTLFSIYIIAVPFFFCCSGFLFFKKISNFENKQEEKLYFLQYQKRIWLMYLYWSIIYFVFKLLEWIKYGVNATQLIHYFHTCIVFTTYPTIWFLPALGISIAMVYFLNKKFSYKNIFLIGIIFYIIGSIGYSYSFILKNNLILNNIYNLYNGIFRTTRNGIFNGFTFVAIGALVANNKSTLSRKINFLGLLISLVLTTVEAIILKILFNNIGADTVFSLIPFTYFTIRYLTQIELKERQIYRTIRKMSLLIFTSQRLFLTAIPGILPSIFMEIICKNSYIGLVIIVGITCSFSYIILKFSKKYSALKYLL